MKLIAPAAQWQKLIHQPSPNGGRALAFLSCSWSAGSLCPMTGTFYPKIKKNLEASA